MTKSIKRRVSRRNDAAASPPPAATAAKPTTVENVLADVRDRVKLTAVPSARPLSDYGSIVAVLTARARAGNNPLHFDASVACDYRETMLEIASIAVAAVSEHDRRALALPAGGGA